MGIGRSCIGIGAGIGTIPECPPDGAGDGIGLSVEVGAELSAPPIMGIGAPGELEYPGDTC